jgi:repressor LexA
VSRSVGKVPLGWPSPAEDELVDTLTFDEWLILNPTATFIVSVRHDDMTEAGILPNDVLVVDTSLKPRPGDIVVAIIDDEWMVRYFHEDKRGPYLTTGPGHQIRPQFTLVIHSVVTAAIRKLRVA